MGKDTEKIYEPVKLFSTSSSPDQDSGHLPIIFIPGFFSTNRTFNSVKYKISRRTKRKVYTIDLRNHGQSGWSDNFTLDYLVADLKNFMATENIPKAVLAGHSMGGRLALAMALKHPDMVEKLVVEDMAIVTTEEQNEFFKKTFVFGKVVEKYVSKLSSSLSEKEAQKKLLPLVSTFWPEAIKSFSNANFSFTLPIHKTSEGRFVWDMNLECVLGVQDDLHLFNIDLSDNPVYPGELLLLAGGNSDVHVQDDLEEFYKYIPKTECKIVENGYHTYHIEFPELYVKLVSDFIGE